MWVWLRIQHLNEVMEASKLASEPHRQLCLNHRVQVHSISIVLAPGVPKCTLLNPSGDGMQHAAPMW